MEINVSKIVSDKLEQLNRDGVIQQKIEEALEKSIMEAITSELSSYQFRRGISEQVAKSVHSVAADCGFSAYNGFIAQAVKSIVQDMFTADISQKVQDALDDVMLKKHENIKLSDIFTRYREWVWKNTEESDKWERTHYTGELSVEEDGAFTRYICRFADHPLENVSYYKKEKPEIEVRLLVYGEKRADKITSLFLDGRNLEGSVRLGHLTEFEAFLVNLYYNGTEIIIDPDDVDDSDYFDIDI